MAPAGTSTSSSCFLGCGRHLKLGSLGRFVMLAWMPWIASASISRLCLVPACVQGPTREGGHGDMGGATETWNARSLISDHELRVFFLFSFLFVSLFECPAHLTNSCRAHRREITLPSHENCRGEGGNSGHHLHLLSRLAKGSGELFVRLLEMRGARPTAPKLPPKSRFETPRSSLFFLP